MLIPGLDRVHVSREQTFFLICTLLSIAIVWPVIIPMAAGAALAYVCEGALDWMLAVTRGPRARLSHGAVKARVAVPLIPVLTSLPLMSRPPVEKHPLYESKTEEKDIMPGEPKWRWAFALVLIVSILALFLVPMALFVVSTFQQATVLFDPESNPLLRPGMFNRGVEWLAARLDGFGLSISIPEIVAQAKSGVVRASNFVAGNVQLFLTGTPEGIVDAFLLIMTWAIFLVDGRSIRAFFIPKIIPWDEERRIICNTTGDVLRAVILSNIIVSVVQAIVVLCFLWPTGTPNFLLWAGLAFFLSFVPLIGTAPIMIGAAIYAFKGDHIGASIALGVGTLIVGATDNILRPYFVKGRAELSFFWVFIAFIGGIAQFGIAGTVLGPLAFSLFVAASKALQAKESDATALDGSDIPSEVAS